MNTEPAKRILIVEDDTDILASLVDLLEEEGFLVMSAHDGQKALDLLRTSAEVPALILLDLMMPGKDGAAFRAEQELDPRLARIPVILMSADDQLDIKKFKVGLRYHIKKPIDLDSLLAMVKQLS